MRLRRVLWHLFFHHCVTSSCRRRAPRHILLWQWWRLGVLLWSSPSSGLRARWQRDREHRCSVANISCYVYKRLHGKVYRCCRTKDCAQAPVFDCVRQASSTERKLQALSYHRIALLQTSTPSHRISRRKRCLRSWNKLLSLGAKLVLRVCRHHETH